MGIAACRLLFIGSSILLSWLSSPIVLAQEASGTLEIELNSMTDVSGGCRLSFVATNSLGDLDKTALEIVEFDSNNLVNQVLVLDFGKLPNNKTRVIQFDVAHACQSISRLLVNQIAECSGAAIDSNVCLKGLKTANRTTIKFGM